MELYTSRNELHCNVWIPMETSNCESTYSMGKWACTAGCNEENHHMHRYCEWCKERIDFYTSMEHKDRCKYGIGLGQIHPPMDPSVLRGSRQRFFNIIILKNLWRLGLGYDSSVIV